jgi:hypothetical protein
MPKYTRVRSTIIVACVVFLLAIAGAVYSSVKITDINVSTGQLRTQTKCFSIVLSESFDNSFADLVIGDPGGKLSDDWKQEAKTEYFPYCTHCCVYGGIKMMFDDMLLEWNSDQIPIHDQRLMATYFMSLLHAGRIDRAVTFFQSTPDKQIKQATDSDS